MEKRCPRCGLVKDASEFGKNKRTKSGLAAYCKLCTGDMNREQYLAHQERRVREAREFREANRDLMRERERERWQRRKGTMSEYRKGNRDMINAARAKWRAKNSDYYIAWRRANPDRIEYEKAWRKANWDRVLELSRVRRQMDPGPFLVAKHAYRARLRNTQNVPYTGEQLRQKFEYHGGRCWICKKLLLPGFHWDHVKPLMKGGPNMLSNLRPACGPCNQAKRDRWPYAPSVPNDKSQLQPATSSAPPT